MSLLQERVAGQRAVIAFRPKPASAEKLVAGVVVWSNGDVHYECASDSRKMAHAFGELGAQLHDVAERLCQSLAEHWTRSPVAEDWVPPFNGAALEAVESFTAQDLPSACRHMLNRVSTVHTLLHAYDMQAVSRKSSIVDKVRSVVRRDVNTKHLATRFNRQVQLNGQDQGFRVDFLGQRYACYFLQVTHSARGIEANTERAMARLFELQAIHRLMQEPTHPLDLLEDERPQKFELLLIGQRSDSVQRRAIHLVEALADKKEILARVEASVPAAAERVSHQERLAA